MIDYCERDTALLRDKILHYTYPAFVEYNGVVTLETSIAGRIRTIFRDEEGKQVAFIRMTDEAKPGEYINLEVPYDKLDEMIATRDRVTVMQPVKDHEGLYPYVYMITEPDYTRKAFPK